MSDTNKPLLLANPGFITYLVDALLVDSTHPRAGLDPEVKVWCQETHAECLAQLSVSADGRNALLQEPLVSKALQVVTDSGLSDEARQHAQRALLALSGGREMCSNAAAEKHVMLSCT